MSENELHGCSAVKTKKRKQNQTKQEYEEICTHAGLAAALAYIHEAHWAQVCPTPLITLLIWSAALETERGAVKLSVLVFYICF